MNRIGDFFLKSVVLYTLVFVGTAVFVFVGVTVFLEPTTGETVSIDSQKTRVVKAEKLEGYKILEEDIIQDLSVSMYEVAKDKSKLYVLGAPNLLCGETVNLRFVSVYHPVMAYGRYNEVFRGYVIIPPEGTLLIL